MGNVTDIKTRQRIRVEAPQDTPSQPDVTPVAILTREAINQIADEVFARMDAVMSGRVPPDAVRATQGVIQGLVMACNHIGILPLVNEAMQQRHDTPLDLMSLRIPGRTQ